MEERVGEVLLKGDGLFVARVGGDDGAGEDDAAGEAGGFIAPGLDVPADPVLRAVGALEEVVVGAFAMSGEAAVVEFAPRRMEVWEEIKVALADDLEAFELELLPPALIGDEVAHVRIQHGDGGGELFQENAGGGCAPAVVRGGRRAGPRGTAALAHDRGEARGELAGFHGPGEDVVHAKIHGAVRHDGAAAGGEAEDEGLSIAAGGADALDES